MQRIASHGPGYAQLAGGITKGRVKVASRGFLFSSSMLQGGRHLEALPKLNKGFGYDYRVEYCPRSGSFLRLQPMVCSILSCFSRLQGVDEGTLGLFLCVSLSFRWFIMYSLRYMTSSDVLGSFFVSLRILFYPGFPVVKAGTFLRPLVIGIILPDHFHLDLGIGGVKQFPIVFTGHENDQEPLAKSKTTRPFIGIVFLHELGKLWRMRDGASIVIHDLTFGKVL
jgi:hypothetical protein